MFKRRNDNLGLSTQLEVVKELLLSVIEEADLNEKPDIGDWCIDRGILEKGVVLIGMLRSWGENGAIIVDIDGSSLSCCSSDVVKIPSQHVTLLNRLTYLERCDINK